jgi:DNA-binding MarR family transcriptional regulator
MAVRRCPNRWTKLQMRSVNTPRPKPRRSTPATRRPGRRRPGTAADLALDESVGYQVRMTNRAFQMRLRERVEPFGVSQGMWYFLRLLWQEDGRTQRELGRRIGLKDPTAFTALSKMEARGLVERSGDPTDRRKVNVFLSTRGKALREDMLPLARQINAEGLHGLTKTEIKTLLRLLKRIEANLLTLAEEVP